MQDAPTPQRLDETRKSEHVLLINLTKEEGGGGYLSLETRKSEHRLINSTGRRRGRRILVSLETVVERADCSSSYTLINL